jgi:hypothetical protein
VLRINVWPVGDRLFGAPSKSAPGTRAPLAPPKGRPCSLYLGGRQEQVELYLPVLCVFVKRKGTIMCFIFVIYAVSISQLHVGLEKNVKLLSGRTVTMEGQVRSHAYA